MLRALSLEVRAGIPVTENMIPQKDMIQYERYAYVLYIHRCVCDFRSLMRNQVCEYPHMIFLARANIMS